ncbi:alpha/beta hydrolase [Gorillibacterium sp. sgz5001074]|uniref:alpha/beta hydrolase n=1 Tax=Gorillibacterium sp. sgz5001074 TaxID=3446695 RepID=UPI003F67283B
MAWLHVHYHSEALRMPVPMEVLVPQHVSGGYRKPADPGPYATLYLLHGRSDDHTAWMRRTAVERYTEGLPLAVVMPAGHLGYYTDMAYGRDYFRFISEELPAVCERMFPLSPAREDRFIAGNSMGGYGAMKAGLRAPERFTGAYSLSGAMDTEATYDRLAPKLAADIWGDRSGIRGGADDLFAAAERLAARPESKPELYMWCGTEDFLYGENLRFKEHAERLGLPLVYEEGPGDHTWTHWDRQLEQVIRRLPLRKAEERSGAAWR